MKNRILRLLCLFCVVGISFSTLPTCADDDFDVGKLSSVYGYVVDDYLRTYGVISNEHPTGSLDLVGNTGIVYCDTVLLDPQLPPYLLIYLTEAKYHTSSCHIWKYNDILKRAERVAILEKDYNDIIDTNGEFSLGWTDEKKYVIYKEYRNNQIVNEEYYTAVDDDAFRYVNTPKDVNEVGIMDFNRYYFHSGIDISEYNKQISTFYDGLKNDAANSIELENFADRLSKDDESALEVTVSKVVGFKSFDISDYDTTDKYEEAVKSPETANRFYLITHIYNLGDQLYYLRFSTNQSYYNYALLRKTDVVDAGYQILKIMTDCIPLSSSELNEIKNSYEHNNLLYKKSKSTLKAQKLTDKQSEKPQKEPKIKINKIFDKHMRIPAACIGGAIVLALLTMLWIKLYNDD